MEILVSDAIREHGVAFGYELEEAIGPQEYCGRTLRFKTPLSVKGEYVFDGKFFTVTGTVHTVLLSECARCAELFDEELRFSFEERFVRDAAAEEDGDDECYPYEGDRLVLDSAVMDNLYLSLPIVSVCREDCKGLCPVCGANRNVTPCDCEQSIGSGPFSVLSQLSFDDEKN